MTPTPLSSQLGTQQFMSLLVAQVQHQDPLEPIANQDFLAQLAQFSSLSSLEQLNTQFSSFASTQQLAQSSDLLGHLATYGADGRSQGIIEQLRTSSEEVEARINANWVPISEIHGVALVDSM